MLAFTDHLRYENPPLLISYKLTTINHFKTLREKADSTNIGNMLKIDNMENKVLRQNRINEHMLIWFCL